MKKRQNQQTKSPKTGKLSMQQGIIYLTIIIVSFALYGNTISHEFAFDDHIVITKNNFTQKGIEGIPDILANEYLTGMYGKKMRMYSGGRYRPLSLVMFAIEWEFFGENPHVNHFFNILLYALTGIVMYRILEKLFLDRKYMSKRLLKIAKNKWYVSLPFVATMLYLAHPVHTEVVANIKGRDEIMAFLGMLLTLLLALRYVETKKMSHLISTVVVFFLALLSKENAITFLAVIPLTIYLFRKTPQKTIKSKSKKGTKNERKPDKKTIINVTAALLVPAILFLIIRQSILQTDENTTRIAENLMTNSFLYTTFAERYATTFYSLGLYLKLLFFPHPLTFDYYPYHIPLIDFADFRAIIPMLIYIAMLAYAIYVFKKKPIISYGIFFYLITFSIVSNIFFSIGTFMSERFMYAPSFGFCLIIAYLLVYSLPQFLQRVSAPSRIKMWKTVSFALFLLVGVLFAGKTISRNRYWKNNYMLFLKDVETSRKSLKSTAAAGEQLILKARKMKDRQKAKKNYKKCIDYFTTTVNVYPEYIYVLMYLAEAHYSYNRNYMKAMQYYRQVLHYRPDYNDAYENISERGDFGLTGNSFQQMKSNVPDEVIQKLKPLENQFYSEQMIFDNVVKEKIGEQAFQKFIRIIRYFAVDYKISVYEYLNGIAPNRFDVNYGLGTLYGVYKNNIKNSKKYLEKAVKLNPENADAHTDLAVAYAISGEFSKSIATLQKAVKIAPNDAQIWKNLAIAYEKNGQTEKAKACYAKVDELEGKQN